MWGLWWPPLQRLLLSLLHTGRGKGGCGVTRVVALSVSCWWLLGMARQQPALHNHQLPSGACVLSIFNHVVANQGNAQQDGFRKWFGFR